jgi:hypothetical protein
MSCCFMSSVSHKITAAFLRVLYSVFLYIYLNADFLSDCNLYTTRLQQYNGRRNIGCNMNVVYGPPETGLV